MNNLVKINNTDLLVKEFNGQRVVTFKDIDMLHQRPVGTAKRNFNENKKHFINNGDYFVVNGNELRTLKQSTNFILSNAKEIILLTESGYLMLVKSLTDDLAWKVQRELINNYFRVKDNMPMDLGLANQMINLAQGTQVIGQVVQGLMQTIGGIKEYVQDSIQAKDKQIDDIAEMVGLRTQNRRNLTDKLKSTLQEKHDMRLINSNMEVYIKAKLKIFNEFNVSKWEDIPVTKYSAVLAFIEEMI